MQVLATDRMRFRKLSDADAMTLYQMDCDPRVTEFLGHVEPSLDATREWIRKLAVQYPEGSRRGFWAADLGDEFIGWFHLRPSRDTGECELGYRLKTEAWGQGLATEGSKMLIDFANERVIARTLAENHRSRRVMEKVGMTLVREIDVFWVADGVEYATT
ncbi:MAG: GNAT family N-acetyltransferase [Armatimonadota bacterium]